MDHKHDEARVDAWVGVDHKQDEAQAETRAQARITKECRTYIF